MATQKATKFEGIEVPKRPPGTLCGVEVSYRPVITFTEGEQTAIKELCATLQNRDMPARREQVVRIWEKRLFSRGFQHLLPVRAGGWRLPTVGSGYGPGEQDSRSIFETNIYSSYMDIVISALTRDMPNVRFKPGDPDEDADITAAEKSKKLKAEIERNNNMIALMADEARFLWTDSLAVYFTCYMKDGSRFGYEDQKLEAEEEETVPEDEEEISEAEAETDESGQDQGAESRVRGESETVPSGSDESSGESEAVPPQPQSREPRGREVICVDGALEWKFPIKADRVSECLYVQRSEEIDLQTARAKYPDKADQLQPASNGPGGDDIDRLARINTRLGVFDNYVTTDSAAYDVTEQTTWLRTAQLLEIPKKDIRESLIDKAGEDGLRVIFCGQVFCEGRQISMDDQVTLVHAGPGDGINRPGLGDWLMPIQKVLNNWMELSDDYFIRGVPNKWMDNEMFSLEKMRDQTNTPGAVHPFDREDGVTMDQVIWEEQALQYPQYLWEFIQLFQGPLPQLLCGGSPALSGGGDAAATDTYGGMLVQRDQALGRIGIPWRAIKEGHASAIRQAIMALAHNHGEPIKVSDKNEQSELIQMEDLKGNFLCYAEADENFPATWTQRQNRLALIVQDAATNPLFMQIMDDADNLEIIKDGIGLEDMVLPILESRDKELGEITELLNGGPVPNPKIPPLQMQLKQLQAKGIQAAESGQMPDPQHVQAAQQIQQQLASLPPMVSSVPVRWADDDSTELATCKRMLNTPRCRKMANGDENEQAGYANLELHAQEHEAAMKQKAAQQPPPKGKPPSVSLALKDMPPKVAAEAATAAGLPATAGDFAAQQVADAAEKHPTGIVQ